MEETGKVTRYAPTKDTLSLLFSLCGNVCAFPGCNHPVFDNDNTFIAQVCHIESASEGGQRFNKESSNEERRQFHNLLILCYPHHKKTDNVKVYTVEKMKEMKTTHEARFRSKPRMPEQDLIDKVFEEEKLRYLEEISRDSKAIRNTQELHTSLLQELVARGQKTEKGKEFVESTGYDLKIDNISALRKKNQHSAGIDMFNKMREDDWIYLSDKEKYRVLANLGLFHLDLLENEKAGQLFIDALSYQPDNPKAISFGILGYSLSDNIKEAEKWITKGLEQDPEDAGIYSSLVRLNAKLPIEDILKLVPQHIQQKTEVAYELARSCRQHKNFGDAITWAQIALDDASDNKYELKAVLASIIMESVMQPYQILTGQVGQDIRLKAEYIIDLYTQAWDEVKNTDLQKSRNWFLTNRGVARKFLRDKEGAYEDFNLASQYNGDFFTLRHLVISCVETGRHEKAGEILTKLRLDHGDKEKVDLDLLESDLNWEYGDKDKALKMMQGLLSCDLDPRTRNFVYQFLIERYTNAGSLDQAQALNAEYSKLDIGTISPLILEGKILLNRLQQAEATDLFEQAYSNISDDTKENDIYDLARQFQRIKKYDNAVRLLEGITNLEVYSDQTKELLEVYFNAGEYRKLLAASNRLVENYGPITKLTELRSFVYENIQDFDNAITACKEYLDVYPDDQHIQARLGFIYSRIEDWDQVRRVLTEITHLDRNLPAEVQFRLAVLCRDAGDIQKFNNFSYETRRQFIDDVHTHENFIHLKTVISPDEERDEDPQIVCLDSSVTLSNGNSNTTYTIEDRQQQVALRGEITPDSWEGRALLGKMTGDVISFVRDGSQLSTIIAIRSKHNHALRESFDLLDSVFAGRSRFKKFTIGNSGDFKTDFKALFDNIDLVVSQNSMLDDHLRKYTLPICAIAQIKKTNLIKVWSHHVSTGEDGILHTTTPAEVVAAHQSLERNIPLMFDLTTLCTIAQMEAYTEIELLNNPKFVSQSSLQVIYELIHELEPGAKDGSLTIGKQRGQYIRQVTSAEVIQQQIRHLRNIVSWANTHCTVLPCLAALDLNANEKQKLDNAIGESSVDTILTANTEGHLLYSEDANLRRSAEQQHGLRGTGSFMIFLFLKIKGKINHQRYTELSLKLFEMHYRGIPPELAVLMAATNKTRYKLEWPLNYVLESLLSEMITDEIILKTVFNYFVSIYKSPIRFIFDRDIMELRVQLVIQVLTILEEKYDMELSGSALLNMLEENLGKSDPDFLRLSIIIKSFCFKG